MEGKWHILGGGAKTFDSLAENSTNLAARRTTFGDLFAVSSVMAPGIILRKAAVFRRGA